MSYEGYNQYLCANGHLRVFDCWELTDSEVNTPGCNCGAPFVFHHSVDETNGQIVGLPQTFPYPFEVATPEEYHTCSCGNKHIIREATYKIPAKGKLPDTLLSLR